MSENIFKQGCGKDMFMVDTVSFPSLWYPFGEYVYTFLSAGIYQARCHLERVIYFLHNYILKDFQITRTL